MLSDAFILAAGHSTRIATVAGGLPKPLLPVAGEPILTRNVRWLARAGVRTIWVNLHHRGDLIRAALGHGEAWNVRIRYSDEPVILGTAGGVRKVLALLSDTFLVVYGDNLVELDVGALVEMHRTRAADVTIAVFDERVPNTGIAGGRVVLGAGDVVEGFVEGASDARGVPWVNGGVYVVQRQVMEALPEGQFLDWGKDVFPGLLARGARVLAYQIRGYCLGLDTPASYERGLELIAAGRVVLQ
jgi:NDP-sugar pyrophosphorylase family protein